MNDETSLNSSGVSVIIPVFNEKESVSNVLIKIRDVLLSQNIEHEIIAVNDGSNDGSGQALDTLQLPNLKVSHHQINKGYGASLKTGIRKALYNLILITDSDGTYPIEKIPELISHMRVSGTDMVVGTRTGEKVHDTFFRSIGRNIVRRFASFITGYEIPDVNSGLRIFKKEDAIRFWNLFPDGFSFTTTITVASHVSGNKVEYLPINYHKRAGKSSIKPAKDFIGFLSLIVRLALYFRPLKVFTPLALILFILSWFFLIYSYLALPAVLDATWAVLFISSIQILIFGLIADMIVKRFYND